MKINLKTFIEKYIGRKGVGNTDANKGQCVGLAMVWVEKMGLSHVWGHARDIYYNAPESEWEHTLNISDVYPNTGDVITWDNTAGGGYGHIAIVVSSDKDNDTVTVFEQNNWTGDNDPSCELTEYGGAWLGIIGWLTPKGVEVVLEGEETEIPETSLKDTIIDWYDCEGKSHNVGFYVYEWCLEKKTALRQVEEIKEKIKDYERIQETLAEVNQINTTLIGDKKAMQTNIDVMGEKGDALVLSNAELKAGVDNLNEQIKRLELTVEGLNYELKDVSFWSYIKAKFIKLFKKG